MKWVGQMPKEAAAECRERREDALTNPSLPNLKIDCKLWYGLGRALRNLKDLRIRTPEHGSLSEFWLFRFCNEVHRVAIWIR